MRSPHPDPRRRDRAVPDQPIATDPLVAAFERTVARDPGRPLVLGSDRSLSAGDLDAMARTAGAALTAATFTPAPAPGELVSFQSPNGPGFLAGLIALLRSGAAPLLLDARTPPSERARISTALGARRIFSCDCAWPSADAGYWRLGVADPHAAGAGDPDGPGREPTLLAPGTVVKLTSGSTGEPRGILTPGRCLLADDEALAATMGIRPDDRLLAAIPLSHSYGLSSLAVPALVRGQQLVLPDPGGPFAPLAAATAADATVFPTVPAYLAGLVRVAEPPPLPTSLRLVLTAGAPLEAETSARFHRRFRRPVHVFYGSSESGGICYDREGGAAERGTVGVPIEGVRVEIGPAEGNGGEEGGGRVSVSSPAVSCGYLPADPGRLSDGRFLTGDLAVWRDGELALRGRLGDIINVRGKKVNPREVEAVLRRLPAVDDVAVLGTGGNGAERSAGASGETAGGKAGGDGERVRAVVACRPGGLTREGVLAWCREHLADHKRPRSVLLVERLPRTERGKLDRTELERLGGRPGERPGRRDR